MKAKDWQEFQQHSLRLMEKYAGSVSEESAHTESLTRAKIVSRFLYLICIMFVGAMGTAIGKASGVLIAAPTLPALAFFWLGKRFLSESKKPYLPLLSILFGHSTWMLLSVVLLTGVGLNPSFTLEAILYFSAVVWLAMKPGRVALIVLSIYTTIALLSGLAAFNTPGLSTEGLVLQIGLRIVILLMMTPLLFNLSARRQSSDSVEEQPALTAAGGAQQGQDLSPQGKEKDFPDLAVTREEVQQDFGLTALTKEKQELLKKKAYLDLQAEVERLREDVATKVKKP